MTSSLSRIYSLRIYLFFKELIHILPVCNNVHRPVKPFLQLILYPNKHEKVIDTIRWNRHYPQINYLKTNELDI